MQWVRAWRAAALMHGDRLARLYRDSINCCLRDYMFAAPGVRDRTLSSRSHWRMPSTRQTTFVEPSNGWCHWHSRPSAAPRLMLQAGARPTDRRMAGWRVTIATWQVFYALRCACSICRRLQPCSLEPCGCAATRGPQGRRLVASPAGCVFNTKYTRFKRCAPGRLPQTPRQDKDGGCGRTSMGSGCASAAAGPMYVSARTSASA
jgi:hypothetical protein